MVSTVVTDVAAAVDVVVAGVVVNVVVDDADDVGVGVVV